MRGKRGVGKRSAGFERRPPTGESRRFRIMQKGQGGTRGCKAQRKKRKSAEVEKEKG